MGLTSYWGEAGLAGTERVWQKMGTSSWEFSWNVGLAVVQPEQRWEAGMAASTPQECAIGSEEGSAGRAPLS